MLKKVGISLLVAMMLSSVALACDYSSIDDEDFLCDFSLVDDAGNKQVSKQEDGKVLKFDKEVVKKIIMEDFPGCTSWGADDEVNQLGEYDARLQPVLDAYIADRTILKSFNVEGFTIKNTMDKYGINFWIGLSYMNIYIKNPGMATEMLTDPTPVRVHSLGGKNEYR